VELSGALTRGTLVLDKRDDANNRPLNLRMVQRVNDDLFKKYLLRTFGHDVSL